MHKHSSDLKLLFEHLPDNKFGENKIMQFLVQYIFKLIILTFWQFQNYSTE